MLKFNLENIKTVPQSSGVYFFFNDKRELIYIGKAINLRNRLKAYLNRGSLQGILFEDAIKYFEFQIASDEREAFILERDLVKNRKPKYNIRLRDDKNFLFIRLERKNKFPRFSLERKIENHEDIYLGPFIPAVYAKMILNFLQKTFKIRTCREKIPSKRERPCLDYFLGLCTAPCVGYVSESEYREQVEEFIKFSSGDKEKYIEELRNRMKEFSYRLEYEKAAELRDTIRILEKISKKTHRTETIKTSADYWGIESEGDFYLFFGLFYKDGEIFGQESFFLRLSGVKIDAILEFLSSYYEDKKGVPEKIFIDIEREKRREIKKFFESRFKTRVALRFREFDKDVLENIKENIRYKMMEEIENNALLKLQSLLSLKHIPQTIEGFDVSHLQGYGIVGSSVRFSGEAPDKRFYRRYFLYKKGKPDDPDNMYNLLKKRFRGKKNIPDLIVVDGGKAQLLSALKVKREFSLDFKVISIAKGEKDKIILEDGREFIDDGCEMMKLIKRIRDEAHRFALKYHRKLRFKEKFEND